MSSSQSDVRKVWEHCIFGTMFFRSRCHKRPLLYYTDDGSMVLDAREMSPSYPELLNAISFTCDLIAGEYGFYQDLSVEVDNLFVWKEGSGYIQHFKNV